MDPLFGFIGNIKKSNKDTEDSVLDNATNSIMEKIPYIGRVKNR